MIVGRIEGIQEEMEWSRPALQTTTNTYSYLQEILEKDGYQKPPGWKNLTTNEIESAWMYRLEYGILGRNSLMVKIGGSRKKAIFGADWR